MSSALSAIVMKTLNDACPDMDWASGSVSRELIAVPAALLGNEFDAYAKKALSALDINALRASPNTYKQEIDAWLELLGCATRRQQTAKGTLKIYLSKIDADLVIMSGTMFSVGDTMLRAVDTTTWVAPSSVSTGNAAIQSPDGSYSIEIGVSTTGNTSVFISTGTTVSWPTAPTTVTGVYVSSPICGGTSEMTYSERVELIYDRLQQPSLTTEDNIQSLLRQTYPDLVNSVSIGPRAVNKPNTVNLYVKPVYAPAVFSRRAVKRSGATEYVINGCGVYAVSGVIVDNKVYSDYDAVFDGVPGASDSTIVLDLRKDIDAEVIVQCTGFDQFNTLVNAVNDVQTISPYTFRLLMPTIAYVYVSLQTDEVLQEPLKTAIQDYINTCTLRTSIISDTVIADLAEAHGMQLSGPTFYTVDVIYGATQHIYTAVGSINIAGLSGDSAVPTACYTFLDRIGTI